MVPQVIDYQTAMLQQRDDVARLSSFAQRPPAKLGEQEAVNPLVAAAALEMFEDPANLERGAILSRLLRLPPAWRNTILEYVGQTPEYRDLPCNVEVELLNAGGSPVELVIGATDEKQIDPLTGELGRAYDRVKHYETLEPKGTKVLSYRWAMVNLGRYGAETLLPAQMSQTAASPHVKGDRPLLEVAYRVVATHPHTHQRVEIDSKRWAEEQAREAEEATAAAAAMRAAERAAEDRKTKAGKEAELELEAAEEAPRATGKGKK